MDIEKLACPFCATEISATASVCPSCQAVKGYRLRSGMKPQFQVIAYAAFLCLVAFGCGFFALTAAYSIPVARWLLLIAALILGASGGSLVKYALSKPSWYRAMS